MQEAFGDKFEAAKEVQAFSPHLPQELRSNRVWRRSLRRSLHNLEPGAEEAVELGQATGLGAHGNLVRNDAASGHEAEQAGGAWAVEVEDGPRTVWALLRKRTADLRKAEINKKASENDLLLSERKRDNSSHADFESVPVDTMLCCCIATPSLT